MIKILSLFILSAFVISFIGKNIILYKHYKINPFVIKKGNKESKTKKIEGMLMISFYLWAIILIIENFNIELVPSLYSNIIVGYLGIILMLIALVLFIVSVKTMKTSWRVGIDKENKTKLVTNGIFSISRNPVFLSFDLILISLVLVYPNIIVLLLSVIDIYSINLQIKEEEKHLINEFGDEYKKYCKKVRRYI